MVISLGGHTIEDIAIWEDCDWNYRNWKTICND